MPNVYGSLWTSHESHHFSQKQVEESEQFTNNGLPTCRVTLRPRTKHIVFQIESPIKKRKVANHIMRSRVDLDSHFPQAFLFS